MTDQITDERRRETARRLREAAPVKAAAGIYERIDLTCACWLSAREPREARECAARLADLIDRPTCAMEEFGDPEIHLDVTRQQCSRCHAVHLEQPNDRLRFRFCPVCGAEVVRR